MQIDLIKRGSGLLSQLLKRVTRLNQGKQLERFRKLKQLPTKS